MSSFEKDLEDLVNEPNLLLEETAQQLAKLVTEQGKTRYGESARMAQAACGYISGHREQQFILNLKKQKVLKQGTGATVLDKISRILQYIKVPEESQLITNLKTLYPEFEYTLPKPQIKEKPKTEEKKTEIQDTCTIAIRLPSKPPYIDYVYLQF